MEMAEVAAANPTAAGASWSFSKMLADPNFQLLLANMGKAADPEGAGGVIGGAAANMISSKAAQGALEKREAQRQAQIKQLIDTLGGVTPKDQPGVTSIKRTPSGGVAFDLDLPSVDQPVGTGTVLAPPPERTQLLTGEQPRALRTEGVRDIADIFPFY